MLRAFILCAGILSPLSVAPGTEAHGGWRPCRCSAPERQQAPATTPQAVTIVAPKGAVTLKGDGATRTASVIVRNDTRRSGTPHARIVGDAGAPVAAKDVDVSAQMLAAGAAGPVTITVTGHPKLSGRLIVSLPAVRTARDAVTTIAAEAPAPAKRRAEPGGPTIELVQACPMPHTWILRRLCGSHPTSRVWVAGVTQKQIDARTIRGLASGDGGQNAVAVLQKARGDHLDGLEGPPSLLKAAEVTGDVTAHGDYKAVLTLDPDAVTPTEFTVAMRARHWAGWALLAILVGAILGFLLHTFYEAWRGRATLRLRLITLRDRYAAALPGAHPGVPRLVDLFGEPSESVPPLPTVADCRKGDLTPFGDLYCRVRGARSADGAAALETAVVAMEDEVGRWLRVNAAMGRLQAAFEEQVDKQTRAGPDPFMEDTASQLERVNVPADDAQTTTLVTALDRHCALIGPYEATRRLSEDRGDAGQPYRPRTIYRRQFPQDTPIAGRSAGDMQALANALAAAREALAEIERPGAEPRLALLGAGRREAQLVAGVVPPSVAVRAQGLRPVRGARALVARLGSSVGNGPSLRSLIGRADIAVFAATLLIAAVAYLVTIYSGQPWGSMSDYATAFTAGFGGQLLVGVAAFPLVRETIGRVAPPKA